MTEKQGRNDPCNCGSGKKYKNCCGAVTGERVKIPLKNLKAFESTPGFGHALLGTLDPSYQQYFVAAVSGKSTTEAEQRIATIPEDKRYLSRVLDSLETAFADFDSEAAKLDLPYMQQRKPEAIRDYLQIRLMQLRKLLDAVADYVDEKYPKPTGHS